MEGSAVVDVFLCTVTTPAVTKPKRHHFLPEFYLKGFTRDGYLWLYDRERDAFRQQTPSNTGVIGHFYTFTNTAGECDSTLEGVLSTVEGLAKPIIEKLRTRKALTAQD